MWTLDESILYGSGFPGYGGLDPLTTVSQRRQIKLSKGGRHAWLQDMGADVPLRHK